MNALLDNVPLPPGPPRITRRGRRRLLLAILATAVLLALGYLV